MSAGFLGRRGGARLTPVRLAVTLGACAVACAAITVLAALPGIELGAHGWHLAWLDPARDHDILWAVRLPRVLGSLVVGAALAAAGCAFQAVLRNPLAEPFTLGVSAGSSLAAVIALRLGLEGALGGTGVGLAALVGAAATVAVVWQLGRVGGSLPPATLLLAGVTITMFCSAASMLVQYTSDFAQVGSMVRWMMGGFEAVRMTTVEHAAPAIGVGLTVLLWFGRDLNALAAGPEAAASVGVSAGRVQTVVFGTASLLVGASIAIGGPIGFVGLMVPHGLRALVGPDHRVLLPASMLVGGAMMVVCDTIGRLAIAPAQLPVGVVTSLIGAPFFLFLLMRAKRGAGLWGGQ